MRLSREQLKHYRDGFADDFAQLKKFPRTLRGEFAPGDVFDFITAVYTTRRYRTDTDRAWEKHIVDSLGGDKKGAFALSLAFTEWAIWATSYPDHPYYREAAEALGEYMRNKCGEGVAANVFDGDHAVTCSHNMIEFQKQTIHPQVKIFMGDRDIRELEFFRLGYYDPELIQVMLKDGVDPNLMAAIDE